MKILLILLIIAFAIPTQNLDLTFPGIKIPIQVIEQARRAHLYLAYNLENFSNKRMSKYNLYLAVQNYKENLDQIKLIVLQQITSYILGSNNMVIGRGNIVLGSNNKLAGNNNWILTEKEVTSKSVETNILYFKRWRIKLDYISSIQYDPSVAIESMDPEDYQLLSRIHNSRDMNRFNKRKRMSRMRRWMY